MRNLWLWLKWRLVGKRRFANENRIRELSCAEITSWYKWALAHDKIAIPVPSGVSFVNDFDRWYFFNHPRDEWEAWRQKKHASIS